MPCELNREMRAVEEIAFVAAPKGQADLVNSQAKELWPDPTLERTSLAGANVTDGEPQGKSLR